MWQIAAPVEADGPLIIDVDAPLVDAHSETEGAQPTFRRGCGFAPLLAFRDRGAGETVRCLAGLLRTGKATANMPPTTSPRSPTHSPRSRPNSERLLDRGDSGAGTHAFSEHLHRLDLQCSVGIGGWPTALEGAGCAAAAGVECGAGRRRP